MGDVGRHELKYVVEEARARAITGFLRGYLRPSTYNRLGPVPGESVISLYFDSPDLLFYRQASCGIKNRVKLRVRFYDNDWDHPAFLEIKRRVSDVICKERTTISRDVVRQLLRHGWPSLTHAPDESAPDGGKQQAAMRQRFSYLCSTTLARPVLYVAYFREAFVVADSGDVRVTLDRQIRATQYEGEDRVGVPTRGVALNPYFLAPDSVVLELKFTGSCPRWMQHMVRTFNLSRRSVSKYCACVEAIGLAEGRRDLAASQRWTVA